MLHRPGSLRSPLAARVVLFLGGSAAAALLAATWLDLGDPSATASARLEAEAESVGRLVATRWREALARPAWLAASIDQRILSRGSRTRIELPAPEEGAGDGDDRLRMIAARDAEARRDVGELRRLTGEVLDSGGAQSGEALLTLVRGLRGAGLEAPAAAAYLTDAARVPWSAAIGGTSGRLLSLLSAANGLDEDERRSSVKEFARALANGLVALPEPHDVVRATSQGFQVALDPWWGALQGELTRRLEGIGLEGDDVFLVSERIEAALPALCPPAEDQGAPAPWRLRPIGDDAWLATRRDESGIRLAIHRADALATSVAGFAGDSDDLVASAFRSEAGMAQVAAIGALEGTDVPLSIHHPDPERLVRVERRRLTLLRAGLVVLALLVLVTTGAAARSIARTREVQALRSTFVASVSHDLRTPLASIGLMAENLSSGYARGNEARYVDAIRRETGRLGRLVDDLLDFGRLERGLMPRISRSDVAVAEWLDAFEARERARCAAADRSLSVERVALPDTARLDAEALERALSNLIDNALKHADTDAIRLRVRGDEGSVLAFEVEDAGRGLPRGVVHEHLFEPFRRAGEAGGTGLGLAIVRAIAEAHGGAARLAPGPRGIGLVASVTIPVGAGDAA